MHNSACAAAGSTDYYNSWHYSVCALVACNKHILTTLVTVSAVGKMSYLKDQLTDDMKSAMRSGDKARLLTIRLILAAIKQQEVDTRKELTDQDVVAVLTKMQKQRRESITHFDKANRQDLVDKETAELRLIGQYLPKALSEVEVDKLIAEALSATGATSIKDMGKVMAILKPKISGRADLGKVSAKIKSVLNL